MHDSYSGQFLRNYPQRNHSRTVSFNTTQMKIPSILFLILLFGSCNEPKVTELMDRVNKLETENKELKEEIENFYEEDIIGTVMIPYFDKEEYSPDGKGKITFKAQKYGNFNLQYNVHDTLDHLGNGNIIMEKLKDSKFEYSFDLTKMEGNKINLWMEFKTGKNTINVPAKAEIKIKD